ncbi:hypothetical protein PMKS-001723 [Pichia membranifaciens]|uniref:Uncharacterized protein n=1 Tax=Pichia membranifaciens TaxID=4926 RepID=A0A1Q2YFU4_9ASCO|nr:hypothetical protein PMKS-001723 [Pichia membranifaciens]
MGSKKAEEGVLSTEHTPKIAKPPIDLAVEDNEVIMSNGDASDDDEFGDFEEVDQIESTEEKIVLSPKLEGQVSPYDGDYRKNEESMTHLLGNIFNEIADTKLPTKELAIDGTPPSTNQKFVFNERASKVFDQLISDDDRLTPHIIWRKSMIFKQLMLNLNIPIENINQISGNVPQTSSTNSSTEFRDLYDRENTINVNSELENLLAQVPDFTSLGIDKKSEILTDKITNTTSIITAAHHTIRKHSEDDEGYLVELVAVKKNLLNLLSVWDEKMGDIRADNELFSSYVENLIGNTQKFRRVSKIAK